MLQHFLYFWLSLTKITFVTHKNFKRERFTIDSILVSILGEKLIHLLIIGAKSPLVFEYLNVIPKGIVFKVILFASPKGGWYVFCSTIISCSIVYNRFDKRAKLLNINRKWAIPATFFRVRICLVCDMIDLEQIIALIYFSPGLDLKGWHEYVLFHIKCGILGFLLLIICNCFRFELVILMFIHSVCLKS